MTSGTPDGLDQHAAHDFAMTPPAKVGGGHVSPDGPVEPEVHAHRPPQVLTARDVPLGGMRALHVRRTLPHKDRPLVGAWCFVDHYGPEPVRDARRDGMDVPPHPHIGLQTVSWLFDGAIEHRDSGGVHAVVRPGEMNLMTSGRGIVHSEVSTPRTRRLHGVQLWVALPESTRNGSRGFQHHAPTLTPLPGAGGSALVFIGELPGVDASPVVTDTPLLGAEMRLTAGAVVSLAVDRRFEHALLVDAGRISLDGVRVARGDLACVDAGADHLTVHVGEQGARLVLLGGEPFPEEIVMWWNFVGRSHDDIVDARAAYEAGARRFGSVAGYEGALNRIPAPPLPSVRLKPRGRRR